MKYILAVVGIIILGAGAYYFFFRDEPQVPEVAEEVATTTPEVATTTDPINEAVSVLGESAGNLPIRAYHFGTGDTELLFVGGIHGGYGWNTALVGYELIDYLTENPNAIPANVRVTVVPVLNPDGLNAVVGTTSKFAAADAPTESAEIVKGRFNSNDVDLNRNFDCDWKATGTWQSTPVSGGTAAFSEPEADAIRAYVDGNAPAAVVVWYSAAGGVFASNCHSGVLPETTTLTKLYAEASDYPAHEEFDFYEVTGDMTNWLAKENIPAISVLLTNHTETEWSKNKAGIDAVLKHYAK